MSSETKSISPPSNVLKFHVVLLDVAGTTTSINFVKETLFPFVTSKAESFLTSKWEEDPIKNCIKLLKDGSDLDLAAAIEKVTALTEEGSSNEGLKTLQGLIYQEGYEKGDLKAQVFDDVPEALKTWAETFKVAVYSTGSTASQKLLFTYTNHGDLSGHISAYFDQSVGVKTEANSYKAIAEKLTVSPEEIAFVTDDAKEAKAAKEGGLTAILIKREGNAELDEESVKEFTVISSFKEVEFAENKSKRKLDEAANEEAPLSKIAKTEEVSEKKTEEEKTESMEVDVPNEEKPEETEKKDSAETEPEKTETTKTDDVEMGEKKELAKVTEKVEATKTEESKMEDAVAATKEPAKATEETKTEATTEQVTEIKEKPTEVETTKVEEKTTEAAEKVEEAKGTEKVEEKSEATGKVEETKGATVEEKTETKETEPTAEAEEMKESTENGEKPKVEEKENKSELANGVENGKEEQVEEEEKEVKQDEEKAEETAEVVVKKLEETPESKTVSVEV